MPPTAALTTVVTVTRRKGRTVSSTARPPPDVRGEWLDAERVGPPRSLAAPGIDAEGAAARPTAARRAPRRPLPAPGTGAAAGTRTGGSRRVPSAATSVAPANVSRLAAGEVSAASPATAAGPTTPDTPYVSVSIPRARSGRRRGPRSAN